MEINLTRIQEATRWKKEQEGGILKSLEDNRDEVDILVCFYVRIINRMKIGRKAVFLVLPLI